MYFARDVVKGNVNTPDNMTTLVEDKTTEIVCIVDKSASMLRMQEEALTGLNLFLKEQSKEGNPADRVTITLFDQKSHTVREGQQISAVEMLRQQEYMPSGLTALNDAIGSTVATVVKRQAESPTDRVLVLILTDGEENSSRTYQTKDVKKLVEELRTTGKWEFIFLGVGEHTVLQAMQIGVSEGNTQSYDPDKHIASGDAVVYKTMSNAARNYRLSGDINYVGMWNAPLSDIADVAEIGAIVGVNVTSTTAAEKEKPGDD